MSCMLMAVEEEEVKESSLSSHLHDSSNRMPSTFNLARKMMKWDVPSGLSSYGSCWNSPIDRGILLKIHPVRR